jgi:ribosomal protein S18 acetylase RimI-like enzyme
MTCRIEILRESTPELVHSLNQLLPQLSSSASSLTSSDMAAIIATPGTTLFGAFDDAGSMIGTLTLVTFAIPTGRRAWIEDVVVDESARGLGAGRALTLAAIAHAQEHGVRSIDLTSRPSREPANAMYVSLGFQTRDTNVYRFSFDN